MIVLADQRVSYINRITDNLEMCRLIHFHIEWLTELAVELASVVDSLSGELPRQQPKAWWINGG